MAVVLMKKLKAMPGSRGGGGGGKCHFCLSSDLSLPCLSHVKTPYVFSMQDVAILCAIDNWIFHLDSYHV